VRVHEAQKGDSHLKQTAMLTTASLLTIVFMTLHLTGDILFKMSPAGFINLLAVFIFVGQLYGTLVLGERERRQAYSGAHHLTGVVSGILPWEHSNQSAFPPVIPSIPGFTPVNTSWP
jgi:hypothetical protein